MFDFMESLLLLLIILVLLPLLFEFISKKLF